MKKEISLDLTQSLTLKKSYPSKVKIFKWNKEK